MQTIQSSKLESLAGTQVKIPHLEEYEKAFTKRYYEEESFRKVVHKYLGLKRAQKLKTAMTYFFSRTKYEKRVSDIIRMYSEKIHDESVKALQVKMQLEALENAEVGLTSITSKYTDARTQLVENQAKVENARTSLEEQVRAAEDEARKKIEETTLDAHQRKLETAALKNIGNIINEKAKEYLKKTGLVHVSDAGILTFDESRIMNALEDIFLKEIIEGIEKESGPGFMGKTHQTYDEVITHWEEMQDLGELNKIDWLQSIIYSRTKGYRVPTYPFFIVGKSDGVSYARKKVSVNTATCVDVSGSMNGERLELAKKCVLAEHALMRKLNPKSSTYLACFSDNVTPLDTVTFFRSVRADGNTNTDRAMKWLYESLENQGPGIAYLITDGAPTCDWSSLLQQCNRFKETDYLRLRIFLIEGDGNTRKNVREIGKAAGEYTKVIPVERGEIGKGLIKDIPATLQGMIDIKDF